MSIKIENIKKSVKKIGRILIRDSYKSDDIVNNPHKGIIPRGLHLESDTRNLRIGKGTIVVGINPGTARKYEFNLFKKLIAENRLSYDNVDLIWQDRIKMKKTYFEPVRKKIISLGLSGPILWTDLVKCESKKNKQLDLNTYRYWIQNYLIREIKILPSAPIVALGRKAFEYCSLLFPYRKVIGFPHPSGKNRNKGNFYVHSSKINYRKLQNRKIIDLT